MPQYFENKIGILADKWNNEYYGTITPSTFAVYSDLIQIAELSHSKTQSSGMIVTFHIDGFFADYQNTVIVRCDHKRIILNNITGGGEEFGECWFETDQSLFDSSDIGKQVPLYIGYGLPSWIN